MKLAFGYLMLGTVFIAATVVTAGEFAVATNAPEDMAALSNYLRIANAPPNPTVISNYMSIAAQCNQIAGRVPPPKDIEKALSRASFGYSEPLDPKQADWPQKRREIVSDVLTNLARLEDGLRLASAVTNIELEPPDRMYYLVMAWQTNQLRTHPEMVAARTAGQAQQRLSDLYQDLLNIAAVRDRIIENIAEAYANPPAADDELTRLLKPYSGYNFADEIRKALKRKEQELSESSRIDGKSNETGSSDEHD